MATGLHTRGYHVLVVPLYAGGSLEGELRRAGVPVHSPKKKGRWDLAGFLGRLVRILRREKPDVLHGYLGGPNVLTVALKLFVPRASVVWGLRGAALDLARYDRFSRLVLRAESLLARFADLVIINSYVGRDFAIKRGLPPEKLVVIPNGIDTIRFRPDREAGRHVRAEWKVDESQKLVGLVARLIPIKDHSNFLRTAALLAKKREDLSFVCVGDGRPEYRDGLHALSRELGLEKRLIWAGARDDTPAVFNALDVAVSSSYGEGFPNAVGEAMACGVPCVVTDIGDSAAIVGDTGLVVPARNSEALAQGIEGALELSTESEARRRVVEDFSISALVSATEAMLSGLKP
ncbi:MAG: glycosyltransferase [Rubrobacteraceae bacterium]